MALSNGLAAQGIPGIREGVVQGPAALLSALSSAAASLPDSCIGKPLAISLRFERAIEANYPLWAFWLKADAAWGTGFAPLSEWRSRLPASHKALPLLVMARSQGRWDLEDPFRPEFAHLLREKDPLGNPDGGMLVHAAAPGTPPGEALHASLQRFLDSIRPSGGEDLPENCLVARSGCRSVEWDLPLPATLLARMLGEGSTGRNSRPSVIRIPLTPSLRVRARWKGPLLWGAWRAAEAWERFLALGYRGGDAMRIGLDVRAEESGETHARFHRCLADASSGMEISRAECDHILSRGIRTIARNLAEDGEIGRILETPYAVLLRRNAPKGLSLFEAVSLPSPEPPEASPGGFGEDGSIRDSELPKPDLRAALQREREAAVVFSLSTRAAGNDRFPTRRPA